MSYNNREKHRYKPYVIYNRLQTQASTLFHFQKRCVLWLSRMRKLKKTKGCIVNLDVGFGKTVISLYHAFRFGWNVLYVCPPNSISHVCAEIKKHFGANVIVNIASSWPFTDSFYTAPHVTILSYYTIGRMDATLAAKHNWHFKTCIVDEVHDAETKPKVRSFIRDIVQTGFFIGLTAAEKVTLGPLCELLHMKQSQMYVKYQFQEMSNRLKNVNISPIIFTFRQPPHFLKKQIYLQMSENVAQEYNKIKTYMQSKDSSSSRKKGVGLGHHTKLKQTWELLSLDKVPHVVKYLLDIQIPEHYKVVIVSNYVSTLRALAQKLPQSSYILLDTKIQGQSARQDILNKYECGKMMFLLASTEVIYLTINLGYVDALIKLDMSYAADANIQLHGRLRRLGQTPRNVKVQHIIEFIMANTADEALFRANQIEGH